MPLEKLQKALRKKKKIIIPLHTEEAVNRLFVCKTLMYSWRAFSKLSSGMTKLSPFLVRILMPGRPYFQTPRHLFKFIIK